MIRWTLSVAWFALSTAAAIAANPGGGDVSVALFSTRRVHSVTVTALDKSAWVSDCFRCAHRPLTAALHISGTTELFAGGALRVTDDASGDVRAAAGLWHLRSNGGEQVDVILTMPSERYVAAVLNMEASANEPQQSLRALAIVIRTYALNGRHYSAGAGHLPAELCDSTKCQAMRLAPASPAEEDAVLGTAGETLWFGDRRADVFFSQQCGGTTEDASAAWPGKAAAPYLRSHPDPYCLKRGNAAWHAEVPLQKLIEIAQAEGWHMPAKIVAAHVSARSASHRALRVTLQGEGGYAATVSASALRFAIGRALGWDEVRSDAFEVAVRNDTLVFDGHGHGHGVGLCQVGAAEMASEGRTDREVLAFYFPGTAVRLAPGDDGWIEDRVGPVAVRAAQALSAQQKTSIEQAWASAQQRFPPHQRLMPEIVLAPTTELFRQMALQPGWALASTRDRTIVLQPEAVLQSNGRDLSSVLVHELLHVLVESECSARTPLWLREGLVEALAENGDSGGSPMSPSAMDRALQNASSLEQARRAHNAAAMRVRMLLQRYGLPAVRGWLQLGVPAGAAA